MHTILVVDDDPICRELMRRLLPRAGYTVVIANNGKDALEALAAHPADLVLLDLAMPQMDGLTFLRILRENPKFRDLPVILVTAVSTREIVKIASALGVRDYFIKAEFAMEALWERIGKYLKADACADSTPDAATAA